MLKVNLVGSGKVGQTLVSLIQNTGKYEVTDIASLNLEEARAAAAFVQAGRPVRFVQEMRPADIWFITVPDNHIAGVSSEIASLTPTDATSRPVAVHCSGFFASSIMASLSAKNWHVASLHPILTFADPRKAIGQFPGTYCGVEGDEQALAILVQLVEAIGGKTFGIQAEYKALYHAAAVFSNNFTVVLQAVAREAWKKSGVPDSVTEAINANLVNATVENLLAMGPHAAITGPAARGDTAVVDSQMLQVTQWFPEAGELYCRLSILASRLKTNGSVLPEGF